MVPTRLTDERHEAILECEADAIVHDDVAEAARLRGAAAAFLAVAQDVRFHIHEPDCGHDLDEIRTLVADVAGIDLDAYRAAIWPAAHELAREGV